MNPSHPPSPLELASNRLGMPTQSRIVKLESTGVHTVGFNRVKAAHTRTTRSNPVSADVSVAREMSGSRNVQSATCPGAPSSSLPTARATRRDLPKHGMQSATTGDTLVLEAQLDPGHPSRRQTRSAAVTAAADERVQAGCGNRGSSCANRKLARCSNRPRSHAAQGVVSTSPPCTPRTSPGPQCQAAALQWGSASPRRRVTRPASNPSLPQHLTTTLIVPAVAATGGNAAAAPPAGVEAARLHGSVARTSGSKFQSSAAERARARARALGGNPDAMFDRLVSRAGMQMPIVRTIPIDGTQPLPPPGTQLAMVILILSGHLYSLSRS
jgi:hypothetical protein